MFLHLCLLTAGLHFGRSLVKKWQEPSPELQRDTAARDKAEVEAESGSEEESAARQSTPELAHPSLAGAAAEEEEIEEQFNTALVSTGLTTAATLFFPPLRVLGGAFVLYGGIPIMERAKELIVDERRVGAEVLDTIGMITTLATNHVISASLMFLLYAGGRKLRLMTEGATKESMLDAFGRRTNLVWVEKDGIEIHVPIESLRKGDVVVIDAGSPIPADGIVKKGLGLVDQHILTGESQPLEKGIGDRVFAATVVFSGRFHIEVTITGKDTIAAEIAETLRRSAAFTHSLEAEGQTIADELALPTLALSTLSYPFVGGQGSSALLNSSFLDSMRLFIPFSMLNYLRSAYDAGLLIKDGRSLQVLPEVDTVIFDKTGTLTLDHLRISRIHPTGDADEGEVLMCAAAAEHRQTHPIAAAILEEVKRRGQTVPSVDETEYEIGYGLTAKIGEDSVRVGSKRFMAAHGIEILEATTATENGSYNRGCSLVYVARGEALIGVIELEPTIRPEVDRVLGALRARNVALYLLSGDHETPTRTLAESLGFDRYFAGVLPKEKARLVEELQAQGRTVCFVGDGINDAIALKKAAVSASMGDASAAAMDSAQITLLNHGLDLLPTLFELADDFQRNVKNIKLSLGIPAAIGIGGVFLAGFRIPAMTALYGFSMASGVTVAVWPHWKRKEASSPRPRALPAAGEETIPPGWTEPG